MSEQNPNNFFAHLLNNKHLSALDKALDDFDYRVYSTVKKIFGDKYIDPENETETDEMIVDLATKLREEILLENDTLSTKELLEKVREEIGGRIVVKFFLQSCLNEMNGRPSFNLNPQIGRLDDQEIVDSVIHDTTYSKSIFQYIGEIIEDMFTDPHSNKLIKNTMFTCLSSVERLFDSQEDSRSKILITFLDLVRNNQLINESIKQQLS